jgi:hypothetical protein
MKMTGFPVSRRLQASAHLTCLLALLFFLLAGCAATTTPAPAETDKKTKRTPEQQAGIKIIGVRQASAGYMLDFRYIVEEPIRARVMFDHESTPYLIHEASGARFMVPNPAKVGPLRATTKEPEVGKRYFIFFANPGRYVKPGDLVTVVIGERRFEHLAVR